jgi:hypothetical protein
MQTPASEKIGRTVGLRRFRGTGKFYDPRQALQVGANSLLDFFKNVRTSTRIEARRLFDFNSNSINRHLKSKKWKEELALFERFYRFMIVVTLRWRRAVNALIIAPILRVALICMLSASTLGK